MMIARTPLDHLNAYSEWHNENVYLDAATYNGRLPGEATGATWDRDGKTGVVTLYQEDRSALKRAGYTIKPDGAFEPDKPLVNLEWTDKGLRLREIKTADMLTWHTIRRAGETRAEVVNVTTDKPEAGNVITSAFSQPAPKTAGSEPPTGNGQASLFAKKARVMGMLESIPKNGYNEFQKYKYVTAGDLYSAVRKAMAAQNLAFTVRFKGQHQEDQTFTDNYGKSKSQTMTYVELEFVLGCGDTGAMEVIPWTGTTTTTHDKSIAGAITNAEKAFLLSTFIVSTEDPTEDPDSHDQAETQQRTNTPAMPKKANKPAPKQAAPELETDSGLLATKAKYIQAGTSTFVAFNTQNRARLYSRDNLRQLGDKWQAWADALTPGDTEQEAVDLPEFLILSTERKVQQQTGEVYHVVTGIELEKQAAQS